MSVPKFKKTWMMVVGDCFESPYNLVRCQSFPARFYSSEYSRSTSIESSYSETCTVWYLHTMNISEIRYSSVMFKWINFGNDRFRLKHFGIWKYFMGSSDWYSISHELTRYNYCCIKMIIIFPSETWINIHVIYAKNQRFSRCHLFFSY